MPSMAQGMAFDSVSNPDDRLRGRAADYVRPGGNMLKKSGSQESGGR